MNVTHRLVALCGFVIAAAALGGRADAAADAFDLRPRQKLTHAGPVVAADQSQAAGVEFGIIPTSPIVSKPYYNVFTGMVESRLAPGVPHPVPVLRAAHVQTYGERPDPSKLALDQVQRFANQAELHETDKFIVVSADGKDVRFITLTECTLPQDKTDAWRLRGTWEPLKLVEHIDDPVADVGRAVVSQTPLPIKGRLIFGTRKQNWGDAELHALTLPEGKPSLIGKATEPRVATNGAYVDRVTMRDLKVFSPDSKEVGDIHLDPLEAAEFTISPDGRRVAVSTERFVDVPNELPQRQTATMVFEADGTKVGEMVGYDEAAFLPDGRLLLTGKGGEAGLFIGDLKSGKVEPLEIKDGPAGQSAPEWPRWPAVSPDGKRVAYVSRRSVYVVGIDGRGWAPVWQPDGEKEPQSVPTFSPDGTLLAVNIIPLNVMTGPGTVMVFDIKKHVRQVIETSKGADSEVPLVWQP